MKTPFSKLLTVSVNALASLAIAALVALPFAAPQPAYAAATLQTTHAFLCAPPNPSQAPGPRRVVNTSSTAATQPAYQLNADGCAVIAGADVGFFLSQGFYSGPNTFSIQQTAITASQTASTSSLFIPAYAVIHSIVLSETAGNAITGGVDIGDSGSATRYASAVALSANANVVVADSALTRIAAATGVPASNQVLVVCHTACNSGSINITIVYGYDW